MKEGKVNTYKHCTAVLASVVVLRTVLYKYKNTIMDSRKSVLV